MKHFSGYDYVPDGSGERVCQKGEFIFAAAGLDHGHIYAQTQGLLSAGGECAKVWDPDAKKIAEFQKRFPQVEAAGSLEEILDDARILCVAGASVPADRFELGRRVLEAGKHYFVDKPPFTTLEQLEKARDLVGKTGLKYMPYFAERIHNQAAEKADELVKAGAIGRVLQVLIMAPHRLSKSARPDWFFKRERYGGILTDIGSHQFEQFLQFSNSEDAKINFARVANMANPDFPELQDFGEASLTTDNGASCYCRVDWFTPDGLPVWGDGRTFILGTGGYIEVRKYIDYSDPQKPSQILFLTDSVGTKRIDCRNMGFPFFGKFILDILNNTENAMTQRHAFKAAELALLAQQKAEQTNEA